LRVIFAVICVVLLVPFVHTPPDEDHASGGSY
jgi:hypothetical protein